jgi:anti-sigma regulatory factor (Ser/Thr protein kinase)
MRQLSSSITDMSQVGQARRDAVLLAEHSGFSETYVGRIALIATELGSNLVKHATSGQLLMRVCEYDEGNYFEFLSLDRGPGMAEVSKCMADGYSTAGSPGAGLGAIARIADQFDIYSQLKNGTVTVARIVAGRTAPAIGLVHQPKQGQPICGDAWLVEQCDGQTLCAVADGLGHGPLAATAATAIIRAVKAIRSLSSPSDVIEVAHQAAKSTCGASLGVAILNHDGREVRFAGVGNVSAMVVSGGVRGHLISYNGVVGREYPKLKEFSQPWSKDSLFVMHSDGFSERWDLSRYPHLATKDRSLIAGILYRDFSRPHDDKTVMIIKDPT